MRSRDLPGFVVAVLAGGGVMIRWLKRIVLWRIEREPRVPHRRTMFDSEWGF